MSKAPDPLSKLSDKEVVSEVKRLARVEAKSTADLVAMLAVFDKRKLYLAEGCSSIHAYCTRVLKLSEHAAYNRIEAARAVNRFPVILRRLVESEVSLTAITLLSAHLTPDNHVTVLEQARHKSKSEILKIAARLSPKPDVPATVRKLPAPRSIVGEALESANNADTKETATGVTADPAVGFGARHTASDLAGWPDLMAPVGASGKATAADTARGAARDASAQMATGATPTNVANGGAGPIATVAAGPDALPDDRSVLVRDSAVTPEAPSIPGIASSLEQTAEVSTEAVLHATVARHGNRAAAPAVLLDPSRHRPVVVPLAPERYKVQMTIGTETLSKLRRAQDLLRHQVPDGDLSVVFDRALTLLVTELERRKCATVSRPRERGKAVGSSKAGKAGAVVEAHGSSGADGASRFSECAAGSRPVGEPKTNCSLADKPSGSTTTGRNERQPEERTDAKSSEAALGSPKQPVLVTRAEGGKPEVRERGSARRPSRHIPSSVKRDVWLRDKGRCAFVGNEGRCEQTARLEYHHVVPWAVGGEATIDSVYLLCAGHNRHEATQFFGFDCSRSGRKRNNGAGSDRTGSRTSSRLEHSARSGTSPGCR
jgi:hypothetical protein